MSLVSVKDLLFSAENEGYAIGAFNCNNMEILQAIVQAAEVERAPVIVQASQGAIKYAGIEYISAMGRLAAEKCSVPVALHLDHGTSFEQVIQCLRHGFSSVMIDGSELSFNENVLLTRQVVKAARSVGVSVEAEIGRIGGTEDDIKVDESEKCFTNPREAEVFVEMTEADALAVAIGTAHGHYKGEPELEFERLKEINDRVQVPLVLHGCSGVPEKDIKTAVSLGIRKINIDTDVREAFVEGTRNALSAFPEETDPRKILGPAKKRMQEMIQEKMRIFGCAGRV